MNNKKTFPDRDAVPSVQKWQVQDIFCNDADFEKAITTLREQAQVFVAKFSGKLSEPAVIIEAAHELADIRKLQTRLDHYTFLPVETNRLDAAVVLRQHKLDNILQQVNTTLLFFDNELKLADPAVLNEVAAGDAQLTDFVAQVKRALQISLGAEVENALNAFKTVFNQPYTIYLQAKLADLTFPDFEVNGKCYPMSFVLYEDLYMYSDDTDLRRTAFAAFSKELAKYQETMAAAYYTHVMQEKAQATLRGFNSVIDYLLYDQNVSREMYDRQIDGIMTGLAPVMQKYITHVKKIRGLDTMTYADLKIDLDPAFSQPVTFEQSREYVAGATAVLGEDYVKGISQAFDSHWVDYAQNSGKSTGGFCTMVPDVHPYILMSWTDQLSDVYTLIHELGHAGQMLAAEAQNFYLTSEPSFYLIEAPSTFNELLLTHYLSNSSADNRTQRFARTKMLSNTYFHNFVTHLLEAAHQREVYRLIDAGEAFTAETLSHIKSDVLTQFWGDAVEINADAALTWMRQPHYYLGLYSYTYSAGLTIATQAYLNVVNAKPGAVADWLAFLDLGKMDVATAAAVAGVDVITDAPLNATIRFLDQTVDEIIAYAHLSEALEERDRCQF